MSAQLAPGFPKRLVHPGYAPAVNGFGHGEGKPARFPDVTVNNDDQEAQYRAKGYLGDGEPQAKVIGFFEYPKLLRHPEHVPAQPALRDARGIKDEHGNVAKIEYIDIPAKDAVFPDKIVNNPDEELAAMELGWEEPPKAKSDALAFQAQRAGTAAAAAGSEWPKMINGVLTQDPSKPSSPIQEYPKWSALFNRAFQDAEEERVCMAQAEAAAAELKAKEAEESRRKKAQVQIGVKK